MAWLLSDIPRLDGRVAVVTGANGGLGFQTARVLAGAGAHVVMTARSPERGAAARDAVLRRSPGASLELATLDLGSLEAAMASGSAVATAHPVIDILVNNAGVMATPFGTTADGHEQQLGVNHLGHVAFTAPLLPSLLRARAARVVWLTSTGRFLGPSLDPEDRSLEARYDAWRAYGRSKRAALQVSIELDERFRAAGTRARSLTADPGFARTDLQARSARDAPQPGQRFFNWFVHTVGSSQLRGAMPQLRAATDPDVPGGSLIGLRWVMRGDAIPLPRWMFGPDTDPISRERVWDASERLAGVRLDVDAAMQGVSGG